MKAFFVHHMKENFNATSKWRYFFARREEWSPPLPLGVPRPMSICFCFVRFFANIVYIVRLLQYSFQSYIDIFLLWFRAFFSDRVSFACRYPCGLLSKKSHSLLGHFLNAPFHFTKNAPISQRRSLFGISPSGLKDRSRKRGFGYGSIYKKIHTANMYHQNYYYGIYCITYSKTERK